MRRTVKGSWAVAVVAVTTIGSSITVPVQAATTTPSPTSATAAAGANNGQGSERGKIPGTPAPKFKDKKQASHGKATPAPKRQGPSAESNAWVASRRWAAPEKVAMGSAGVTPGADTWWRFDGDPVVSKDVPGAHSSKDKTAGSTLAVGGARGLMGSSALVAATADDSVPAPGLGVQSFSSVEWFSMREGLAVGVNRANGNVMVRSTDLKINGVGAGTRIEAWINTLSSRTGALGAKAGIGGGQDVGLEIGTSSIVFRGPSGFRATFTGSGTAWTAPAGLNAALTKNADGTWKLRSKGSGQQYLFTAGGMLSKVIDRNGVGLTYTYNADNTAKDVTDAAGRHTTFTYDASKRLTQVSDSAGRTVKYGYTSAGQLASITDANGATTKLTWISSGQLSTITTARGVWLGFGYDSSNRVVWVGRNTGFNRSGTDQGTNFAYPSTTQTVQTNPLGKTWTYNRNSLGLVTAVTDPNGNKKSVTWSANNAVQTATDAMGAGGGTAGVTTWTYDTNNNPTQVKTPDGATTSAFYTTGGNCATYDARNADQPQCTTDDANNKTDFTYDAVGNLTGKKDTTGGATGGRDLQYTYSKAGSTTWGTNCSPIAGQLCTVKDGNGNTTAYWYDGSGNMVKIEAPAPLGARTLAYDALGRVVKSTNGRGQVIETTYDNLDHVIAQHYVGTNNPLGDYTVNYTYDVDSNLTYNTDSTITYDAQNRQVSLKDQASRMSVNGATVAYDAAGNVTAKTDETGATTKYAYDAANQLLTITAPGATCANDTTSQVGCVKFTYNANGEETRRVFPGNVTRDTIYVNSRLAAIGIKNSTTWLGDYTYNYTTPTGGKQSNVVSMRDITHDGLNAAAKDTYTTTYTYDSLKRLTKATETCTNGCTNAEWSYAYDKNGNRTNRTATGDVGYAPTGTTTYGYNAADQISTVNGQTGQFGYDADGNETTAPASPAAWAQPRSWTTWSSQDGTVGTDTPEGGHHFSIENTNPDQTALWEDNGTIIQQSPLGADSWTDANGKTVKYIVMPSGKPVAYTVDGNWNSLLTDKLGSVRVITTENGGIAAQYTYEPYGGFRNVWEYTDAAHANKIQYAGAYFQTGLGIYRMGVRWYDPGLGRFTNPDPSTKEANPYLYAAGNPVNYFDPTGASALSDAGDKALSSLAGVAGAAIGGGIGVAVGMGVGTLFGGHTVSGGVVGGAVGGYAGAKCFSGMVEYSLSGRSAGEGCLVNQASFF